MTVYPDMHQKSQIEIKNKKASFHYELLTKYTAGIVLYGTEIKSIREGKAGLVDSYCAFDKGELWVINMHIAAFRLGNFYNHEAARTRKLLLTKRELRKARYNTIAPMPMAAPHRSQGVSSTSSPARR